MAAAAEGLTADDNGEELAGGDEPPASRTTDEYEVGKYRADPRLMAFVALGQLVMENENWNPADIAVFRSKVLPMLTSMLDDLPDEVWPQATAESAPAPELTKQQLAGYKSAATKRANAAARVERYQPELTAEFITSAFDFFAKGE